MRHRILDLLEHKCYRDAAHWVVTFSLFNLVQNSQILRPLIVNKMYNDVTNYVTAAFNFEPRIEHQDTKVNDEKEKNVPAKTGIKEHMEEDNNPGSGEAELPSYGINAVVYAVKNLVFTKNV